MHKLSQQELELRVQQASRQLSSSMTLIQDLMIMLEDIAEYQPCLNKPLAAVKQRAQKMQVHHVE